MAFLPGPILFTLKEQVEAKLGLGLPLDDGDLRATVVARLTPIFPALARGELDAVIDALVASGDWQRVIAGKR